MQIRSIDRHVYFMPNNAIVTNPHMGFTTFNRFNGDVVKVPRSSIGLWNAPKTESDQIQDDNLKGSSYPNTTIAYFRIYWRTFEPEEGHYRFDLMDQMLSAAAEHNQKLMFRLMPYGRMAKEDVPDWYCEKYQEKKRGFNDYYIPQNDAFYEVFPAAVRAIADRYDKDRRLDSIDMGIIGPWGEGKGTDDLPIERRNRLIDAYTQGFSETSLMGLIVSPEAVLYANKTRPVGFRADSLGDMLGGWGDPLSQHSHMLEVYPPRIDRLRDLWEKQPVSFEPPFTVYQWMEMNWDVDYIIEQSLKWHITSFNAASTLIPKVFQSSFDEWRRRMGYRFALRSFEYPSEAEPGDVLCLAMWMENRGVAPIYYQYPLMLRLRNTDAPVSFENGRPVYDEHFIALDTDCRTWLPGDTIWHGEVKLPQNMSKGNYKLMIALVDPDTCKPAIKMPIAASNDEEWTCLGKFQVI